MPYRRYARKKVYARRKRVYKGYKKRSMMGYRRTRADGGHLEKVVKIHPLTVDAAGLNASVDINWLATGASG